MEAEDAKMFLENIEEFVMDEDKIVTYKWLSSALNLHVNTAKQLLYSYAMPNGKVKAHVHKTYLVGGSLRDGSGIKFQIVKEQDLEKVRLQFRVVTSEHIYSVQKANALSDLNILFAIDNLKSNPDKERQGPIRCKNAVRRLENEITSLKTKARVSVAVAQNSVHNAKKNQSNSSKPDSKSNGRHTSESIAIDGSPTTNSKSAEQEAIQVLAPKSSSDSPTIASMFTAQSKVNNSNGNKVGSTNKANTKKPKGGIAMFFTKQLQKPTNPINTETGKPSTASLKEVTSVSETICENAKPAVSMVDDKAVHTKQMSKPVHVSDTETETKKTVKPSSNARANKRKKCVDVEVTEKQKGSARRKKKSIDDLPAKRRKRILVISDSSSDSDIFGKDESDGEMPPPSPENLPEKIPKSPSSDEDVIPSTPVLQQACNGKTRKRKMVDKTFADKDGFMITQKEYVLESCSEDEHENQANDVKSNKPVAEINTTPIGKNEDMDVETEKDKPTKKHSKGEKQSKKKKVSPPTTHKSKQSSIMSFFNKN